MPDVFTVFLNKDNDDDERGRVTRVARVRRRESEGKASSSPPRGGGAVKYFLGGYVPPGTPIWHSVLKKYSAKIDTPF